MSLAPHNKSILAALAVGYLINPTAHAAEVIDTNSAHFDESSVSYINENYPSQIFIDSFGTLGQYSLIDNDSESLIVSFDQTQHSSQNEDVLIVSPPRENTQWSDYSELYAHYIRDLINHGIEKTYSSIHWDGIDKDTSDFITSGIISEYPDIASSASLVDGGEYISSRLTQVDYSQLLNMEISVSSQDNNITNKVMNSFKTRGFQKVFASI